MMDNKNIVVSLSIGFFEDGRVVESTISTGEDIHSHTKTFVVIRDGLEERNVSSNVMAHNFTFPGSGGAATTPLSESSKEQKAE